MLENENIIKVVGWLMGIIGTLLLLGGGLIAYIFQRHERENDCQFSKNREDHRDIFQIIREIDK